MTHPPGTRNYPLDCWWIAAFSEELGSRPAARTIAGLPVMLYRTAGGAAAALLDRCPHRAAPLSLGRVDGDEMVCGYHGFRFAVDGRCTHIPSQRHVPSRVRVRAFPVVEHPPFVWIYTGDPDRLATVPPPPVFEWIDDPAFAHVKGRIEIDANYLLHKENVFDLTHIPYVHANSFGITDWVDPAKVTVEDDEVRFLARFEASPLAPIFGRPLGLGPDTPVDRVHTGAAVSPAVQLSYQDFFAAGTDRRLGRVRVVHASTPVDDRRMLYFWATGRDHGTDAAALDHFKAASERGFAEDKTLLEAIQRANDAMPDGPDVVEISVRQDEGSIQLRRAVGRWLEREGAA